MNVEKKLKKSIKYKLNFLKLLIKKLKVKLKLDYLI
jgi:hypothetical protein